MAGRVVRDASVGVVTAEGDVTAYEFDVLARICLLYTSKRINLFVVLFLCHWSLIGFSKVYFFGIPEDLLLASALVPALYLFFKEYIDVNFRRNAKPDLRVMNMLLLAMCS